MEKYSYKGIIIDLDCVLFFMLLYSPQIFYSEKYYFSNQYKTDK